MNSGWFYASKRLAFLSNCNEYRLQKWFSSFYSSLCPHLGMTFVLHIVTLPLLSWRCGLWVSSPWLYLVYDLHCPTKMAEAMWCHFQTKTSTNLLVSPRTLGSLPLPFEQTQANKVNTKWKRDGSSQMSPRYERQPSQHWQSWHTADHKHMKKPSGDHKNWAAASNLRCQHIESRDKQLWLF